MQQHIWHDRHDYDGDFLKAAIQGGDDIDYITTILRDGTVDNHIRLNSFEKLKSVVMDPSGPSVRDALTLSVQQLEAKHCKMKSLPMTNDEAQLKQLDDAVALFNATCDADIIEEEAATDQDKQEPVVPDQFEQHVTFVWNVPLRYGPQYSLHRTVWYRVNVTLILLDTVKKCFGKNKLLELKYQQFSKAHLACVQYLDSLDDPSDDNIDMTKLVYTPLGTSNYNDDKDMFKVKKIMRQVRPTPLEMIRPVFSDRFPYWTVEEVVHAYRTDKIDVTQFTPFIDDEWAPIPSATMQTHSIYLAIVFLLNQIRRCMNDPATSSQLRDALWIYYAGFTEVFYFNVVNGMSDETLLTPIGAKQQRGGGMTQSDHLSPWELYASNADTRAYHSGDLPDLFHVLNGIPLWGEQDTPNYRLGKIYQKSLPFACQRRHLIKLITATINEDEAFWRLFSKLFWTFLSGLYPGELGIGDTFMSMRDLLRIKELTDTKEALIHALTVNQPGPNPKSSGANGGPLVVFLAFRLHILYMASYNRTYVRYAEKCVDWSYFKQNTIELVKLVRETSLFPDDPFGQARKLLSKTVKSPNTRVHRFRRRSDAVCITEHLNETLEKLIIKDKHARLSDTVTLRAISLEEDQNKKLADFQALMKDFEGNINMQNLHEMVLQRIAINQRAVEFYENAFERGKEVKSAILNILIRLPPRERLTVEAFSLLTLPQYGGISFSSVQKMCRLTHIYFDNAVPKDFRQCIDTIDAREYVIICFYFNMVSLLEKITFKQLDADTVERTERAMQTVRYHMYPGQKLPDDVYNVCVSLCCQKICNLKGYGKYGSKKVAFNMESQSFVCSSGKSLKASIQDDSDSENENDEREDLREVDGVAQVLEAQEDRIEDYVSNIGAVKISDFIADPIKKKGRGTQRSIEMEARKMVRNERKSYNRVPCGQPVLTINLRGRALIWGNILEKKSMVMFCPSCGALHMYTMLNFSNSEDGKYRCNECAQRDMRHVEFRRCACCNTSKPGQMSEQYKLPVLCPFEEGVITSPQNAYQIYYFCRSHFQIARRFNTRLLRDDLWKKIRDVEQKRMIENEQRFG